MAGIRRNSQIIEIKFEIKPEYKIKNECPGRFPLLDKNILKFYSSKRALETQNNKKNTENVYLLRNFIEKQKMHMVSFF